MKRNAAKSTRSGQYLLHTDKWASNFAVHDEESAAVCFFALKHNATWTHGESSSPGVDRQPRSSRTKELCLLASAVLRHIYPPFAALGAKGHLALLGLLSICLLFCFVAFPLSIFFSPHARSHSLSLYQLRVSIITTPREKNTIREQREFTPGKNPYSPHSPHRAFRSLHFPGGQENAASPISLVLLRRLSPALAARTLPASSRREGGAACLARRP